MEINRRRRRVLIIIIVEWFHKSILVIKRILSLMIVMESPWIAIEKGITIGIAKWKTSASEWIESRKCCKISTAGIQIPRTISMKIENVWKKRLRNWSRDGDVHQEDEKK